MATAAPIKTVLLTDLDNTLFDWVGLWHKCFSAMLEELVRASGVSRQVLIDEFRAVHRRHRTSEYSFALEELPSLLARHAQQEIVEEYSSAIDAFCRARRAHLRLYPGVRDVLVALRTRGCLIVGCTESRAFQASHRVRRLGLDGILDYLFSPEDHDIPAHLTREGVRRYPPSSYEFRHTVHQHTPPDLSKPNPDFLRALLRGLGARQEECVLVGDSLHRDVGMAQAAGVSDVHASYGQSHEREEYELLRAVTHWTEEDVERERRAAAREVRPPHVLEERFDELLELIDFGPFHGVLRSREADLQGTAPSAGR